MLLLVGFVTVFIYILINFLGGSKKKSSAIEEKLDRIIELLEQLDRK